MIGRIQVAWKSTSRQQDPFSPFWFDAIFNAATVLVVVAVSSVWLRQAQQTLKRRKGGWRWWFQDDDDLAHTDSSSAAYEALIGQTPLVELSRLSELTGRRILVKMESLNPGGTGKDRAGLAMILAAERSGQLPPAIHDTASGSQSNNKQTVEPHPSNENNNEQLSFTIELDDYIEQALQRSQTGGLVVEGTSGSTGISLATLCASRGHACLVVMPDDQAMEKQVVLRTLGAVVLVVKCVAISNPQHYVNTARRLAARARQQGIAAVFLDQFENLANADVHYRQTGPELYRQCPRLNAFCMSSGTGGTISGVGRYLKERRGSRCRIVLIDPPGSSLYNKVVHGVAYARQQSERSLRRHRYDTIAEGIGLDRVTANLASGLATIDTAVVVTDQEAVDMAHWLLKAEGLWVGSSSAMNIVGTVRTALEMSSGSTLVTMICDGGYRHVTRFWNRDFCTSRELEWPPDSETGRIPECLQDLLQS